MTCQSQVGAWRSLVAHTLGVRVVAGSNPAAPTNQNPNVTKYFSIISVRENFARIRQLRGILSSELDRLLEANLTPALPERSR